VRVSVGRLCSGCPLWSHGLLSFPVASFRRQQWIVRVPFCPQTQQSSLGWLLHHRAMCPTALHLEHLLLMSNDLVMPPFSACGGSYGLHWFLGGLQKIPGGCWCPQRVSGVCCIPRLIGGILLVKHTVWTLLDRFGKPTQVFILLWA